MKVLDFCRIVWGLLTHKPFNLLDDTLLAEVHIIFPSDGSQPKLFVRKIDEPNPQKIMVLVSGTIQAACDLAKLYGTEVTGSVGRAPHCQTCQCPK